MLVLLGEKVPSNGICRKLDPDKESNHLEDTRKPDRPEGIRKLDQHKVPDQPKGIRKPIGPWPHRDYICKQPILCISINTLRGVMYRESVCVLVCQTKTSSRLLLVSLLYTHHIVILFGVCGFPWFSPFQGFHVNISCLVVYVLLSSCFYGYCIPHCT